MGLKPALFVVGQKERDRAFGFFNADPLLLKDAKKLPKILATCLKNAGIPIYTSCKHKFTDGGAGVTAVHIVGASTADVHTWPEFGTLILRVFACGDKKSAVDKFVELMRQKINPKFAYEFEGRTLETSIPKYIPHDWKPLTQESRERLSAAS